LGIQVIICACRVNGCARIDAPSGVSASQLTTARPSASNTTSTRPATLPPATSCGGENVRPPSAENASRTRGWSGAVNQATATSSPRAATAGPFTGQASIRQPSSCTPVGADHLPATSRAAWMSRVSSAVRLRYTTSRASLVVAASVPQQSQTRSSISTPATAPCGVSAAPRRVIAPCAEPWSSWP
jgi:hypothetical protein